MDIQQQVRLVFIEQQHHLRDFKEIILSFSLWESLWRITAPVGTVISHFVLGIQALKVALVASGPWDFYFQQE